MSGGVSSTNKRWIMQLDEFATWSFMLSFIKEGMWLQGYNPKE